MGIEAPATLQQFEIVATGTVSSPTLVVGVDNSVSVAHNLGYRPVALVYLVDNNNSASAVALPFIYSYVHSGSQIQIGTYMWFGISITNLTINFADGDLGAPSGSFTFLYYLLREKAA